MTGVELSEAERERIWKATQEARLPSGGFSMVYSGIERVVAQIVAARLAPVEAERDEWKSASDDFADKIVSLDKRIATADGTVEALARRLSDVEHNALEVGRIAHFAEARAAKAEALVEAVREFAEEYADQWLPGSEPDTYTFDQGVGAACQDVLKRLGGAK